MGLVVRAGGRSGCIILLLKIQVYFFYPVFRFTTIGKRVKKYIAVGIDLNHSGVVRVGAPAHKASK